MDIDIFFSEIKNIHSECDKSLNGAIDCIKRTLPIIKDAIDTYGRTDERTEALSTLVANHLLDTTIMAINSKSADLSKRFHAGHSQRDTLVSAYRQDLALASYIFDFIDNLPLSEAFRLQRLQPQLGKLAKLKHDFDTAISSLDKPDVIDTPISVTETEPTEIINEKSKKKTLPIKAILILVAAIAIILIAVSSFDYYQEKSKLDKIRTDYTEEDMMAYLSDNDNTHFRTEATVLYLERMDSILLDPRLMSQPTQYPPLVRMDNFSRQKGLDNDISYLISERVRERTDSLYDIASQANTLVSWRVFQALAPTAYYRDSDARIDSLQSVAWASEASAWDTALTANDKDSYRRFIDTYPDSKHVTEAEGRLIDIEVYDYKNRGKAAIDNIDKIADLPGDKSLVYVQNKTDYDMEFLFSGASSRKMRIRPNATEHVELANGEYRVLVIIDDGRRDRFSFTQHYQSAIYSSTLSEN